jgi:hypothetical protein
MTVPRSNGSNAALVSLENAVAATRSGFACTFSTSDEYETAVIAERRAQGRYDRSRSPWLIVMFIGCALVIAGSVLWFG